MALLVWAGAFHVGPVHGIDGHLLFLFTRLQDTPVEPLAQLIAWLIVPLLYLPLSVGVMVMADRSGGRRMAIAAAVAIVGANVTAQALKRGLAEPRVTPWLQHQIGAVSWPSGHATAAAVLALTAIVVAPAAWRAMVILPALAIATGVAAAVLVMHWHYPSDVAGGFAVAGTWVFGAVGVLRLLDARGLRPSAPLAAPRVP